MWTLPDDPEMGCNFQSDEAIPGIFSYLQSCSGLAENDIVSSQLSGHTAAMATRKVNGMEQFWKELRGTRPSAEISGPATQRRALAAAHSLHTSVLGRSFDPRRLWWRLHGPK
jgi:hypothetical protein